MSIKINIHTKDKSSTGQVNSVKPKPNIQNIKDPLAITTVGDIFPASYKSHLNSKNSYKNYDIYGMYEQQTLKNTEPMRRFSLVCNGYKFQAHIDPSHMVDTKAKRLVPLDTLTGIVLQDYGYVMQTIELKGTTGAAYYKEIEKLDDVFSNQSTTGTATQSNPTICVLKIENRTYSGVWAGFTFERQAQENTYKYTIIFNVMVKDTYVDANASPGNFNSTLTQKGKVVNSANSSNGKNQVTYVSWDGKTPSSYADTIVKQFGKKSQILQFLQKNWSSAPQNKRSFPLAPSGVVNPGEVLVVPLNWSTVLN